MLLQEQGDHEGAERAILRAIELDPRAEYRALHSWLLLEQERWDEALAAADAALALDPFNENAGRAGARPWCRWAGPRRR